MLDFNEMLESSVHFGHMRRKWNPKMAPYIFMEKNGIHIIDLNKTAEKAEEAAAAIKQIAKSGKKILFVATKKQAKEVVSELVTTVNMPFVTERWPGGMLTNFVTIRKAVKKMSILDKLISDKDTSKISKRERLQLTREKAKLEKNLGSISDLTRLPSAIFVIDINKEHIAVSEARRLNIPIFALVDTNVNPDLVTFPIPANDDASKSIALIVKYMCNAIEEGLNERRMNKEAREEAEEAEEINENKKLATELLDEDEDESSSKEEIKVKKVRSHSDDDAPAKKPRPRKVISAKKPTEKN